MSMSAAAFYRSKGLCSQACGRPLATAWSCLECAAKRNRLKTQRYALLKRAGLCRSGCGRPLATRNYCRPCADADKERVQMGRLIRKVGHGHEL